MTLSDVASVGSLVSGIAVLASLVYMSLQMRQSARHQQATIQHQRAALVQELLGQTTSSPELHEIVQRGSAGDSTLTPMQSSRYVTWALQSFWLYEEYFYQHQDGMLSAAAWATHRRRIKNGLRNPGFRAAWRSLTQMFEPDFRAFVDEMLKEAFEAGGRWMPRGHDWTTFAAEEVSRQSAFMA